MRKKIWVLLLCEVLGFFLFGYAFVIYFLYYQFYVSGRGTYVSGPETYVLAPSI